MNKKMDSLKDPGVKVVNQMIENGFGFSVPKQFEGSFAQTRVFTYNHFIMIETDPRIEKIITEKAEKVTR